MKQLRTLPILILLATMVASASYAADPARIAPVRHTTNVIVLPQVVIVGKRLVPIEKNRLAQTRQHERAVQPSAITDDKS
ncbi:hypothetical protein [Actimicrobium sp. CCI2.3]|uniref:hypothetical protein n=1 Tax=Actimicrobium sp. CCI2.3 TaxID=3048616 RepID=UPI002AB389C2|nr:hypothetical protein [Actimicrobium sp. CCI2.3]MDY7573936.1 hypothetical protein [Actimicrobium sp. CCI2.3]MEB0023068.1 hypothetical protein [Actimicrobium sp. CCI2.3]